MLMILKYIQEMLTSVLALTQLIRLREGRRLRFAMAFSFWMLIAFGICLLELLEAYEWHGQDIRPLIHMPALLIFQFWAATAVYGGFVKLFLACLLMDILISGAYNLSACILALWTGTSLQYVTSHIEIIYHPVNILLNALLCVGLLRLIRPFCRWFRDHPFERVGVTKTAVFIVLFIMVYPLSFRKNLFESNPTPGPDLWISVTVNLLLLFLTGFYVYNEEMRRESRMLAMSVQYMHQHLNEMKELTALARKLRHDIKRHLQITRWTAAEEDLLSEEQKEQRRRYRQQLEAYCGQLSPGSYCDQQEINAVLGYLDQACRRQGVPLQIRLKDADFAPLDSPMEVMFYSALWAIQNITRPLQRTDLVSLCAVKSQGICQLQMEIHFWEVPSAVGAIRESRRIDREYLGYVRAQLKKNGTAEVETYEKKKTLIIRWVGQEDPGKERL